MNSSVYKDTTYHDIHTLASDKQVLANLSQNDRTEVLDFLSSPLQNFFPNRGQKPIFQSLAPKILVAGGNKSGKTELGGHLFCYHMTKYYPDWFPREVRLDNKKIHGVIVVPNFNEGAGVELEPYLRNMIPAHIIDKKNCHKNQTGITTKWALKNGNTFIIMSCEQDAMAFETVVADFVWVNEPIPRDRYLALIKGFMVSKGRLIITATLLKEVWVWDEFIDSTDPQKKYFVLDISDNLIENGGMLTQHDIDEYASSLDPDEREVRLHGTPRHLVGMIYNRRGLFQQEIHVQDFKDLDFKDLDKYSLGMTLDPHDAIPHAIIWRAVNTSGTCYYYKEGWVDGDIEDISKFIKAQEVGYTIDQRTIDPNFGNKTYGNTKLTVKEEFQKHGLYFNDAIDDVELGHMKVRQGLKYDPDKELGLGNYPKILFDKTLSHTIKSISRYARDMKGKLTEDWKHFPDCMDNKTEILTNDGWKGFNSLRSEKVATLSPKGHLEFQQPIEYFQHYHSGEMVKIEARGMDLMATLNHRMLVYPQHNSQLRFRLAKDLYPQDRIPIASTGIKKGKSANMIWNRQKVDDGDFAEFMGWYLSEGSASGTKGGKIQIPGRGYSIYISQDSQANPENCKKIFTLLDKLPFRFAYRAHSFVISSQELWQYLFPLGNSHTKYIPTEIMSLPPLALKRFWQSAILGDGWIYKGTETYTTVSKQLADDITVILSKLGYGWSIKERQPPAHYYKGQLIEGGLQYNVMKKKCYRVAIANKDREKRYETVDYKGDVFCVSVPNKTLLVRRNGLPCFVGNCVRYDQMSCPQKKRPSRTLPMGNYDPMMG